MFPSRTPNFFRVSFLQCLELYIKILPWRGIEILKETLYNISLDFPFDQRLPGHIFQRVYSDIKQIGASWLDYSFVTSIIWPLILWRVLDYLLKQFTGGSLNSHQKKKSSKIVFCIFEASPHVFHSLVVCVRIVGIKIFRHIFSFFMEQETEMSKTNFKHHSLRHNISCFLYMC